MLKLLDTFAVGLIYLGLLTTLAGIVTLLIVFFRLADWALS